MKTKIIQIRHYHSPCGELVLGALGDKLCLCDWTTGKHHDTVGRRLGRILQADYQEHASDITTETARQLDEYFRRERTAFDVPLLFAGTEFQQQVWRCLPETAYGETIPYAALARKAGRSEAVRAVANAVGANAISILVPCHRVIGTRYSLTGYAGGIGAKKFLLALEAEGIPGNLR